MQGFKWAVITGRLGGKSKVFLLAALWVCLVLRPVAANDCYVQRFVPRVAPLPTPSSWCGERAGPQQMVIMADKPRQAALAAMQNPRLGVAFADRAYSNAAAAERGGAESCVDLYFETVAFSWNFIQSAGSPDQPEYPEAWQLYHSGLQRLMQTSERYGRLDLQQGLRVNTAVGTQVIPVARHGFRWKAEDFNRLLVVTDEMTGKLKNHYYRPGLGVPLVIIRQRTEDERFWLKATPFAATVVLRPSLAVLSGRAPAAGAKSSHGAVDLYDPMQVSTVSVNGQSVKMATDTSAPLEVAMQDKEMDPWLGLVRPSETVLQEKLFRIEPYQAGKYPLVFVHGLMSSPKVWGNIANEILARPAYRDRFQLWAFQYPTGQPFIASAATLRSELLAARAALDPGDDDPAMSQMAIIGHSMGGLVAKLQVTSSDDKMWCSITRRPLHEIRATDAQREELRRIFYFEPLPFVSRVVFIGTPHNGSGLARRSLGRLGACLVEQPAALEFEFQELVRNNPGVFVPSVSRGIPSSVDMLEPNNPLLTAIQHLCPGRNVQMHSIIGTGCLSLNRGPSDGAVPVSSAQHPCSSTQRLVRSTHGNLHDHQESLAEMLCILRRHVWEANDPPVGAVNDDCGPEAVDDDCQPEAVDDDCGPELVPACGCGD